MNTRRNLVTALCLGLTAACGSTSADVPSVDLEIHAHGDMPPAGTELMLAYDDPRYVLAIDLAESNASGSFKEGFSMRLDEAPPALVTLHERDGSPQLALGGFVMVAKKRPPKLYKTISYTEVSCLGGTDDPRPCTADLQVCELSGQHCYTQHGNCLRWDPTNCSFTSEDGDPELVTDDAYAYVRDVGTDPLVLYLAQDLADDSYLAKAIGGITEAGYHLVQPHVDATEQANGSVCDTEASVLALKRFNSAHGTHYKSRTELPDSKTHEAEHELDKLEHQAGADLGCFVVNLHLEPVPHDEPIDITFKKFELP